MPDVYDGRHRRYLRCPDCERRYVYLRLGADDVWVCRSYECGWYAYNRGRDSMDVEQRARLRAANPDRTDTPED